MYMHMIKNDVSSKNVVWNSVAVFVDAIQSAIMLSFISYKLGIYEAGIFTFAYTMANLISTLARYGVRNYQVSDENSEQRFGDYVAARIITLAISGLVLILYLLIGYYHSHDVLFKLQIIGLCCIYKMVDVIEDVLIGLFQARGKLYVGTRIMAIRLMISTLWFCVLVLIGTSLINALLQCIVCSIAIEIILFRCQVKDKQHLFDSIRREDVCEILKKCFPLAVGTTLAMYMGNIPRYMIDCYMTAEAQAIYGYIMMPTFVIVILSRFIYQPMVKKISDYWHQDEKKEIMILIKKQIVLIFVITIGMVLVGVTVGIYVLSIIYNTNLRPFQPEFILLLIGGGLYAISTFFSVIITIIRKQNSVAIGYISVCVVALILGKYFLMTFGMLGASMLYIIINALITIYFYGIIIKAFR